MIEVDEITLAYLQINQPIMACNIADFHKAIEVVLEKPVWTHELITDEIREQVNQKFKEHCEKLQLTKSREREI